MEVVFEIRIYQGKEQIMDRYLVVWLREGRENVDVIDNAITPHEAANKVREIHVNANVVAVGIMLDNKQWNYLQQLKLRFLREIEDENQWKISLMQQQYYVYGDKIIDKTLTYKWLMDSVNKMRDSLVVDPSL